MGAIWIRYLVLLECPHHAWVHQFFYKIDVARHLCFNLKNILVPLCILNLLSILGAIFKQYQVTNEQLNYRLNRKGIQKSPKTLREKTRILSYHSIMHFYVIKTVSVQILDVDIYAYIISFYWIDVARPSMIWFANIFCFLASFECRFIHNKGHFSG